MLVFNCNFFFFLWYWGLNQGLYLEPLHQPFFVVGLVDRVSQTICRCLRTTIFLISASQVLRITGVSYWHLACHLFFETGSYYIAQAGLEFVTLSASHILGLLVCTIMP
jgi:hypothetical protein